ncbi:hypothetical protein N7530_011030 [Penicillium desertorum]|uniref:Jacalin-type lectin domain-containing protein n=1 Tax=Penicillium desertorum TaxID=1303715 RepID=A0A9W9WGG4_9EURO|nr:hypothetical protein N7530_011030 [Penicillium desertorum]
MSAYPFEVLVNSGSIGGNGGGEVGILAKTGGLVEKVGVWASGRDIIGVSVQFTNDEEKQQMGSGKWGEYSEFIFEAAETVKSLSLWGNGKGTNLGRIKFTTSTGRSFDCGGHNGKDEFPQDVGSGLWVGIKGRCGGTVDMLGVYFLKKVASMSMKDVKFKNDPTGTSNGIKSKSVKSSQFPWQGKAYDYKFDLPRLEKESHTVTETSSQTTSLALGFREQWNGEVNLYITKTTLELESSQTIQHSWTKEKSTADTIDTTEGVTSGASGHIAGPGDGVIVEAVTYAGQLDLEYTATIVVKMASGATYNIPTTGTMKKVAYSKVYMSVRPISEDSTLPPGESENRSADDQQFDSSHEERAADKAQDEKTAWSPQDEEDNRYNQYNTNSSGNRDDEPFENPDQSRDQEDEGQEPSDWQQGLEYNQPEEEDENGGWQGQENNDRKNEERSYGRRNHDAEVQTLEDEQQGYQTSDRWSNDRNKEDNIEERSYTKRVQENEERIQNEQDDLSSERWNQDQEYDNRDSQNEREEIAYNQSDQKDEQPAQDEQENLSSEQWGRDHEYNVRSDENEEESPYNRRTETNEDEEENNRQASRWNQDQPDENQAYGFDGTKEENSNQSRFQNEQVGDYTTSRGQDEERYGEEQEYGRGYGFAQDESQTRYKSSPPEGDGDFEGYGYKPGYQQQGGSRRGYGNETVY